MKIGACVVAAVSSIAFAFTSTGTAAATPTNCSAYESGRAVVGTCTGGTGQFRIRAICNNAPDRWSPWTAPGKYASVTCLVGHAASHTFEVK